MITRNDDKVETIRTITTEGGVFPHIEIEYNSTTECYWVYAFTDKNNARCSHQSMSWDEERAMEYAESLV